MEKADSLYNVCQYNEALLEYYGFVNHQGDTSFYAMKMLSKCYAVLNYFQDSIFKYLITVVKESTRFNYIDYSDCVFDSYRCFPEWDEISKMYLYKTFYGKSQFEIAFVIMISSDQKYRGLSRCKADILSQQEGVDLRTLQREIDERNEKIMLDYFIDSNYSIPSYKTMRGAYNGFIMVLLHSSSYGLKKMKRVVRKGLKDGSIIPDDYIYYIDKLRVNNGRKQLYGTQYFFNEETNSMEIATIKNPAKLDKRMRKLGLLY